MMWANILLLTQLLFTTVFLQDPARIIPGSGMVLELDDHIRTMMELAYRRCSALNYKQLEEKIKFTQIITGDKLDLLRRYFIDLEKFEPEVNFEKAVLDCKFIVYNPNSLNKDICRVDDAAKKFCKACRQHLTCYNIIMGKFYANDHFNYTVTIYDS